MRRAALLLSLLFLSFHWFQPGPYYLHRGNSAYAQGNYRKALLFYRRAWEKGLRREAEFNSSCALYMLGEYREAEKKLLNYIKNSEDYRGYFNLGNVYFRLGEYKKAYEMFKKALKAKPDFYPAKINLELSLRKMQKQSPSPSSKALPDAIMEYLRQKEKEVFRKRWKPRGSAAGRDW